METLGSVSTIEFDRRVLRMTVAVRPRGARRMLVRANEQHNLRAVEEPQPFQRLFDALSDSAFVAMQPAE